MSSPARCYGILGSPSSDLLLTPNLGALKGILRVFDMNLYGIPISSVVHQH